MLRKLREKLTHIIANGAVEKTIAVLASWSEAADAAFRYYRQSAMSDAGWYLAGRQPHW